MANLLLAIGYFLVLAMEVSRLFFRAPVRLAVMAAMTLVLLGCHAAYLVWLAYGDLPGSVLASWTEWCLMAAWLLAVSYLWLALRHTRQEFGLFILPLVLGLIGVGAWMESAAAFPREQALTAWGLIHGLLLLAGAVAILLGFVAGLMYLFQSYRLKHHLPPRQGFRLPSLEWLQRTSEALLIGSSVLLAAGLVAGIIYGFNKEGALQWTEPVVWISGVHFLWLAAAIAFNYFYTPARRGRKVAYLLFASVAFFTLELGVALFSQHGSETPTSEVSRSAWVLTGQTEQDDLRRWNVCKLESQLWSNPAHDQPEVNQ